MRQTAVAVLVVLALMAKVAFALDDSLTSSPSMELFEGINQFRTSVDLPFFFSNPILMRLAQQRAEEMAREGVLSLESASGKSIEEELKEMGYPVNRWTIDVLGGVETAKKALRKLKSNDQTRSHLLDFFVMEAGVGFYEDRWAVVLARRKPECGNGLVEAGEDCDDGNGENDDCCSWDCRIESEYCQCTVSDIHPTSSCSHHDVLPVQA